MGVALMAPTTLLNYIFTGVRPPIPVQNIGCTVRLFRLRFIWFITTKSMYSFFLNVKFIHSEKATKFCEICTLLLSYVVPVKSKVEILKNFVAFSEYMNFIMYASNWVKLFLKFYSHLWYFSGTYRSLTNVF